MQQASAVHPEPSLDMPDVSTETLGLTTGFDGEWGLKRLCDMVGAAVGLVLTLPLMVIAAIALRLESPGPVLFRQVRVGRWGKPFKMLKLRSMCHRPYDRKARWTVPGDGRITRVGCFLRRTHFDELPQLWNVLKGEMSLIGPRPEQTTLAREIADITPRYHWRHVVRPGITGWAQRVLRRSCRVAAQAGIRPNLRAQAIIHARC
jgi:lipopolysaccharide/colanic/teichoic acid biosynthesis glycosyltransferase